MVDQIKFAQRVLGHYVDGNGAIEEFLIICQYRGDRATQCEKVTPSASQADMLRDAMDDGIITQDERAKLGFLSNEAINVIAGDDGKKPLKLKTKMLIAGLTKSDLWYSGFYINDIARLGQETRAQFLPIAKNLFERLVIGYRQAILRAPLLDKELGRLNKLWQITRSDRMMAVIDKLRNPIVRELDRRCRYEGALRALVSYLGNLNPPPDFLAPAILNAVKQDTPGDDLAYATICGLVNSGHPEAVKIMQRLHTKHPERDYFKCNAQIAR